MSRHAFTVESSPARIERDGGVRVDVTAEQFPILTGMALATLSLESGAASEPHWHPNAAGLSYCLEGSAQMTIVEPGGEAVTTAIEQGDLAEMSPHVLGATFGVETGAFEWVEPTIGGGRVAGADLQHLPLPTGAPRATG